jgi:hypothetical protein
MKKTRNHALASFEDTQSKPGGVTLERVLWAADKLTTGYRRNSTPIGLCLFIGGREKCL